MQGHIASLGSSIGGLIASNPCRPPGTIAAVITSFVIYAFLILFMGGAFDAETLNRDQNTFQNACYGSKYIVVVGEVSSQRRRKSMRQSGSFQERVQLKAMHSRYFVFLFHFRTPANSGILISSLSSALGSLFGGSRVLQAMSRDKLLGVLKPFAYGSKHGDEPRVAVLFTWLVAQVSRPWAVSDLFRPQFLGGALKRPIHLGKAASLTNLASTAR